MDIFISNTDTQPIYEQIAGQIKNKIISGELSPGEMLPSMRVLAKELRISVITTKRAYEELERELDPQMNSFSKLLYLNDKAHSMMEEKISIDLITSLYSTQLVAQGNRHLLDQNRNYYKLITKVVEEGQKRGQIRSDVSVSEITKYYAMCERALVTDWCLNKGEYSLGEYSRECMPMMMEHFKEENII